MMYLFALATADSGGGAGRGGQWWTAEAADGRLVGLATAVMVAGGRGCVVDGCIHRLFEYDWPKLLQAATSWARQQPGCRAAATRVAVAFDDSKLARFR